jgi:hypothetical protein
MNSNEIVANKIASQINGFLYTVNTETSHGIIQERLAQIKRAMKLLPQVEDCWTMAIACADIWMPLPSKNGPFVYDSVEYNTVEIFCLCVRLAYNDRE